ncbi:MAG: phosphoribosylformylglycinamidine cyclo-ligase [Archaeoglobaceae archaeon]|nr:phosphoribosylformylglycinamidine cyclo-ligase [Archaeoglobaceae archaeon]MDW8117978.1 phosphoribosylformylglycinamidine cyclo-ligase [Archaeoglobaceae archaeon]
MKFDYAKTGVDISKTEKAISALTSIVKYTRRGFGEPILVSHYAGVIDLGEFGVAITTDGVGTKILVGIAMNRFDTLGIDCVAANVNDLLAIGAEPLAMVDYIAMQKIDEKIVAEIAKGLEEGCRIANITLVAGETATLTEMINGFDLAGTAIGVVKKDKIITGKAVKQGDVIMALPSSGIHCNGLTLARKVIEANKLSYFDKFGNKTIGEELLTPTKIYMEVLEIIKNCEVHGLAHITGGAFRKLKRLRKDVKYVIDSPLKPQEIFRFIQKLGNVDELEMYRTFNMGMGFLVIVPENSVSCVEKFGAKRVGYIDEGEGVFVKDLRID